MLIISCLLHFSRHNFLLCSDFVGDCFTCEGSRNCLEKEYARTPSSWL